MSYGTLLGSYFYHDVIPWDDDIDLMVDMKDYTKLKSLYGTGAFGSFMDVRGHYDTTDEYIGSMINKTVPNRNIYGGIYHKHKIFFKDEPEIPCYSWRWPFIDIAFFQSNKTHIWNYDSPFTGPTCYLKKTDYYPLIKRPLGNVWVPSPREPLKYLKSKFAHFECSVTHCHRDVNPGCIETNTKVPCDSLTNTYPYVVRTQGSTPGTTKETLTLGSNKLYTVEIEEKYTGPTKPLIL